MSAPGSKVTSRTGRRALWLAAALLVGLPAGPAMAQPKDGRGGPTTKGDLEKQGYQCQELPDKPLWRCEKEGSGAWLCDEHSCLPTSSRQAPPSRRADEARGGQGGVARR